MATIGDLVANLKVDSRQFTSGLNKSRSSLGGFVKSATSGLASIGLAAQGLKTVWSTVAKPIELAQVQLAAERKLEQVFKTTGNAAGIAADELKKLAADLQDVTNFGDEATISAAAVLGSFTAIKGDVFKQALVSAQDLSAFMGQDLQSSIIQIGKALNDPIKGVSALQRVGVSFNAQQKEQIKTLQQAGEMAGAQAIILKELQMEFGGQAKALVDPIKQAENAWGDFLETIGIELRDKLLPLMPQLIDAFKQASVVALNVFEKVSVLVDRLREFNDILGEMKQAGGELIPGDLLELVAPGLAFARDQLGGMESAQAGKSKPASADLNTAGLAKLKNSIERGRFLTAKDPNLEANRADAQQRSLVTNLQKPAEQMLAGFIRNGIAGLQSGVMSLGSTKKAEDLTGKIGSLEQGSQAAFDVMRANVGAGGKDLQKEQLKELQKQTKALDKLTKKKEPTYADALRMMGIDDNDTW